MASKQPKTLAEVSLSTVWWMPLSLPGPERDSCCKIPSLALALEHPGEAAGAPGHLLLRGSCPLTRVCYYFIVLYFIFIFHTALAANAPLLSESDLSLDDGDFAPERSKRRGRRQRLLGEAAALGSLGCRGNSSGQPAAAPRTGTGNCQDFLGQAFPKKRGN